MFLLFLISAILVVPTLSFEIDGFWTDPVLDEISLKVVFSDWKKLAFKLLTISSGIIHFNLVFFIFICIVTRGLRFFIVAYLTYRFGEKIGPLLEKKTKHEKMTNIGDSIIIIINENILSKDVFSNFSPGVSNSCFISISEIVSKLFILKLKYYEA